MKSNLKKISSLLAIGLLTISTQAAIILQDNFDTYATGNVTNNSSGFWLGHSGVAPVNVVADSFASAPNALQVSQALAQDIHAFLTNGPYATPAGSLVGTNVLGNPVSALYASMKINVTSIAFNGSQTYFTHFEDSSTFKGRVFIVTNGAALGTFRLAIQNSGTTITNIVPVDLNLNTGYTLATRYVLGTGMCTLWLNPTSETNSLSSTNATDAASVTSVRSYAFRQSSGEGVIDVDDLVVGTAFADVVPGSVNPPTIITQPQDLTVFAGSTATFTNLAVGDATLGYQWYSVTNNVTNAIPGATGLVLSLSSLTTNQTGYVFCTVTNGAGTNSTRSAVLTVSAQPIPPTIDTNITPASATKVVGDTVTFTVAAHGLPAPAYQWKFVPNTNTLVTNILAGAISATLTVTNLSTNQSGLYFVTITNSVGYLTTNSAKATLTVNPPSAVSIATLRSMVDPVTFAPTNTTSLFTATGIVTTWADMTGVANTEFYMQDASGGIVVFWSGANGSTNLPPAGALVQVTGPLSSFSGLLEIAPVFGNALHSVTIISTNNPLPKAQPLPFDPNVSGYPATAKNATMDKLEGMYLVASNVMLNLNTPNFVSGANDIITNNTHNVLRATNSVATINFTNEAGQQFVLFVNAQSGLPGQAKYTGPVTVYGVLGYFTSAGYEFTPSRYEDIISYVHPTNVLTHARQGDLATNSYTELVLRPGESLKTHVSIGDAAGGTVTITASTDGLSANSGWSGITSGLNATGDFTFNPTSADAGSNYLVNLHVTSTAGTDYTNTFSVYVPTADEQQIYITEFLANPTTNPAAAFYNPLARTPVVNGIATNDQYVEIANLSGANWDGGSGTLFTLDTGTASSPVFSSFDGSGADLQPTSSLVVYGGNGSPATLPGLANTAVSRGLRLSTSGSGVLVFRNANGNIIDRVVYSASDISTNGSLSRFPALTNGFVAQAYISTNHVTPGAQYDGGVWSAPTSVPQGVSGIVVSAANNQVFLNFTANTTKASTLWRTYDLTSPFSVVNGGQFGSSNATFTETNTQSKAFYFITTQQ